MNLGDSFGLAALLWFLDQLMEQVPDALTDRKRLVGCLRGCFGCMVELLVTILGLGLLFGLVEQLGRLGGCGPGP
jgi:hypothetical protein